MRPAGQGSCPTSTGGVWKGGLIGGLRHVHLPNVPRAVGSRGPTRWKGGRSRAPSAATTSWPRRSPCGRGPTVPCRNRSGVRRGGVSLGPARAAPRGCYGPRRLQALPLTVPAPTGLLALPRCAASLCDPGALTECRKVVGRWPMAGSCCPARSAICHRRLDMQRRGATLPAGSILTLSFHGFGGRLCGAERNPAGRTPWWRPRRPCGPGDDHAPGQWVQYSTPESEGTEYVAVCLPASPNGEEKWTARVTRLS